MKMLSKKLGLLFFMCLSKNVFASSCEFMTAVPINFGIYNPLSNTPTDTTAMLRVSCMGQGGNYQIALSAGRGNNLAARKMFNGKYSLSYNLYTDATMTQIWGDGTNGTSAITGSSSCNLTNNCNRIIYGRMPARQTNAAVGNYSDTIVVTLTY